ncbi:uncharacterized protein LOC106655771 isoform X1 [Trichogramma pretiosum]|uniref:uncharacterized protein LOC106655771 isoform X1 n=1 Tax=Trichogramma pretiosum TaxID=7493 RepID=UPI0006C99CFE|nr:uncharacterized protein LOC106655771 isoform X1 [Trichogramma pretiosum]XP_023319364.1 uncharacterized protein LOC106655771 isoform X1 [Trichogramma pretiosum]
MDETIMKREGKNVEQQQKQILEYETTKAKAMNEDEPLDSSINASKFDATINGNESNTTINESNCTFNSECNVTVIHVPLLATVVAVADDEGVDNKEGSNSGSEDVVGTPITTCKDFPNEGKDSKDGSDSGVEGCAVEPNRVQSRSSNDYASSCNGLDEASCDSSLASCCSVYEDAPCSVQNQPQVTASMTTTMTTTASVPAATTTATTIMPSKSIIESEQGLGLSAVLAEAAMSNGIGGGGPSEGTCSEGGSESSSVAGSVSARVQKRNGATSATSKKKITNGSSSSSSIESQKSSKSGQHQQQRGALSKLTASTSCLVNGTCANGARAKPRTSSSQRLNSLTKSQTNVAGSRDRGRSREKQPVTKETTTTSGTAVRRTNSAARASSASCKSRSTRPDTLPSALTNEINKDLAQRGRVNVTTKPRQGVSASRATATAAASRTTCSTPSEDGRRPVCRSSSLYNSKRPELRSLRHLDKMTSSLDGTGRTIEAYGTIPRTMRHNKLAMSKQTVGDSKPPTAYRSRSGSREASLARPLSRRSISAKDAGLASKSLPPSAKPQRTNVERVSIYREFGVQTNWSGEDFANCLAGKVPVPDLDTKDTQTVDDWEKIQKMKTELEKVTVDNDKNKKENNKLRAEVELLKKQLEEEKADHAFARQELDKNAQRVLAMLGTPQSEHDGSDSFLELETHIHASGKVVATQQMEIADLQSLCRMLSRDLEKSLTAQKQLMQQNQDLEIESLEIKEFLQEEKAMLEAALKDTEAELAKKEKSIAQLSSELDRQTEECKHLVRISEQRRQENLSLSMKLNAVERRSRELLLAQGASVSGASVALSGLGHRLEGLVDQLIISYHISEKDLEDVIYHNEAFSRSNSSVESSPVSSKHSTKDCTPSPKRGSFVSAVIGAIRNAATHPFAMKPMNEKKLVEINKPIRKETNTTESTSDLLDFETEPCLMMENVLEDVSLPDTYSHNMISSCDSFRRVMSISDPVADENEIRKAKLRKETSSLTNLTQAIMNRRKVEDEEEELDATHILENGPFDASLTDYCPPSSSLVDQVIDVDNYLTKLLKVLRIIQLENDTCIQELKDEKTELELRLEILLAERKVAEYSHDEKENYSNGTSDRTNILENYK